MSEFFNNAFGPQNLVYTILLLLVLFYWFTVVVGVFDVDSFDVDVDVDVDIDVDVDVDVDADADVDGGSSGSVNPFFKFLAFFNIGKVPFMIFLSFLVLFLWTGGMLANKYLNIDQQGMPSALFGLVMFLANFCVGIFLTKAVTQPMRGLFKETTSEFETRDDILGKVCEIIVRTSHTGIGQAELQGEKEAAILLSVRSQEELTLNKGDKALIISYDEEGEFYYVTPFNH